MTVLVYEDISRALIGSAMPDFDIAVVSSNYILDYSGQEKACFGAKKMVVMVDVTQFDLLAHWSAKVPYTLLVRPLYRSELLSAVVELLDWETFEG